MIKIKESPNDDIENLKIFKKNLTKTRKKNGEYISVSNF